MAVAGVRMRVGQSVEKRKPRSSGAGQVRGGTTSHDREPPLRAVLRQEIVETRVIALSTDLKGRLCICGRGDDSMLLLPARSPSLGDPELNLR